MKEKIYLWDENVPFYKEEYNQEPPSIVEYFIKDGNSKSCILVIPGGGYSCVCNDHEGKEICEMLNSNGISAAYLNYRVAPYSHPVFEEDAKRAMKLLRYNADKWNIKSEKIGVMGFSAGGHLACMTALRFDYGNVFGDAVDKVSSKPNVCIPCYPVASLDLSVTHLGTLHNLLGENPYPHMVNSLSSENIVRDDTPPFFIWHTAQDEDVNPECSLRLASALIKENIPCELHIFPNGKHGLGLANDTPLANKWSLLLIEWLRQYDF